jgi:ribosome biogenesis GTPase / thiamine phosphate phosphatase
MGRAKEKSKKSFKIKKSDTKEKKFILDIGEWEEFDQKDYFAARVVEVHKKYAFVSPETETHKIDTTDVYLATVAKKFLQYQRTQRNFVVVGDRVLCRRESVSQSEEFPQCLIEYRAERETQIVRQDPLLESREHVLAANITRLVIVASYLTPQVRWGLIDRFLALAEIENLEPIIILNKKDLLDSSNDLLFKKICEKYLKIYKSLGIEVVPFVALEEKNISADSLTKLRNIFAVNISLIVGHSGVGKSSLVNLLNPEMNQEVDEFDIVKKGRHTTSYSSLIKVGENGFIVDTPGVRSLGLYEIEPDLLAWSYREMRPYINKCHYRACQHRSEPDCAVRNAVEDDFISKERYISYLSLLEEHT